MSDYISREAAIDAIADYLSKTTYTSAISHLNTGALILARVPSADVTEVVRCKDCKHYYFAENRIPQEQRYVCDLDGDRWKPNSFCSYGERREDG